MADVNLDGDIIGSDQRTRMESGIRETELTLGICVRTEWRP